MRKKNKRMPASPPVGLAGVREWISEDETKNAQVDEETPSPRNVIGEDLRNDEPLMV